MSLENMIGIPYLEGMDVNSDGSLKSYVCKGKPVLLFVHGNFCPHCVKAKPAFMQLAKALPGVVCATVRTDGGDTDKQAVQNLSSVNSSRGVPAYLGFDKNGKFKGMHNGGRDVASLQTFAMGL